MSSNKKVQVAEVYIVDEQINEFQKKRTIVDKATGAVLCKEYKADVKEVLYGTKYSTANTVMVVKSFTVCSEKVKTQRFITIFDGDDDTNPVFSFWDSYSTHRRDTIDIDKETGEVTAHYTRPARGGRAGYVKLMNAKIADIGKLLSIEEKGLLMSMVDKIEMGTGKLLKRVVTDRGDKRRTTKVPYNCEMIRKELHLDARRVRKFMAHFVELGMMVRDAKGVYVMNKEWFKRG